MTFRDQFKSKPYGSLIWRIFIGVVGGLVTIVGAILLAAPGPGLLVLFAGLGILASEFAWASRALLKTKSIASAASAKVAIPLWLKYAIAAGATTLSILLLVIYHSR